MVNYKLPDNLSGLYVCCYTSTRSKYNPDGYSVERLRDVLSGNRYSIVEGENINRVPFDIAPCEAEALRKIDECKQERQMTLREKHKQAEGESDQDDHSDQDGKPKRTYPRWRW